MKIIKFFTLVALIAGAYADLTCSDDPSEWCSTYRMAKACDVMKFIFNIKKKSQNY
jgi:hypothetical protein